jgi:hypothetical protein
LRQNGFNLHSESNEVGDVPATDSLHQVSPSIFNRPNWHSKVSSDFLVERAVRHEVADVSLDG